MISDDPKERMAQLSLRVSSSNYNPVYRKSKSTGAIIKFVAPKEGYVVDPGRSHHTVGSLRTDWNSYNHDCWEPYEFTATTSPKTPDQLVLFETTDINPTTAITKVPNGYVMTSHSGHQVLIPTNSI